jgi:hypothetical protein
VEFAAAERQQNMQCGGGKWEMVVDVERHTRTTIYRFPNTLSNTEYLDSVRGHHPRCSVASRPVNSDRILPRTE